MTVIVKDLKFLIQKITPGKESDEKDENLLSKLQALEINLKKFKGWADSRTGFNLRLFDIKKTNKENSDMAFEFDDGLDDSNNINSKL